MSALELHADVLTRLGGGDEVYVAEELKDRAAALTAVVASENEVSGDTSEERLKSLLVKTDAPAEELLAVLFPIVEYGSAASIAVIPRALVHVARSTSLARLQSGFRAAVGTLVIGRVVWAMTAHALQCNRLDAVAAAWRAVSEPRSGDEPAPPLLADPSIRHPDAYDRDARRGYESHRSWLAERELIRSRYPLLADELDDAFAEADFLLALRAEAVHSYGVYSHGFTRSTVARFRARLRDAEGRRGLSAVFSVALDELDATLSSAYASVRTNPHAWDRPPEELFTRKNAH